MIINNDGRDNDLDVNLPLCDEALISAQRSHTHGLAELAALRQSGEIAPPFVNGKTETLTSNAGLRGTKLSSVPRHTHTPPELGLPCRQCKVSVNASRSFCYFPFYLGRTRILGNGSQLKPHEA